MGKVSRKRADGARLIRRILRAKARRHLLLARLPIEEKINILVTMQQISNRVRISAGRRPYPEWRI